MSFGLQVAVSLDGTVYVSDGYCNSRVAQFTSSGEYQGDFLLEAQAMQIPHSVLLHECSGNLIAADRESSKVHQFELSTRKYKGELDVINMFLQACCSSHAEGGIH